MSENKDLKTNQNQTSYYSEIGGDFKGIQGDISGGNITQYIITQQSGIEITQRKLIEASPYLGLEKFGVEDQDKFFGRNQWIRDLTEHLKQNKVLLLLGASGSGKSSLIQAGLIPALRNEKSFSSFNIFCFVPDKNPFESFYGSLLTKYRQSEAEAAKIVKEDTLIQVVKSLKNDSQWLIFIDQFEELFTLTAKTEQSIFIKSLTQLIDKLDESVRVVMTMRADFLDKLSPYPGLGKIHDRYSLMLTDMDDSELRLAIAEPAARNGVIFEKGLIDTILADFHEQAGSLPLLQYTLDLLWKNDKIQDRVLNSETYQALGGVRGALQKQANTIYDKFDESQRKLVKQIFLELISLEDKEPVSRRADKVILEKNESQKDVLYQLVDNRLLVSRGDDGKATVEVAHEALLRSWPVLKELIQENEQMIVLRNRLYADAKQWDDLRKQNAVKARGELWSGSKLARIVELKKEQSLPNLDALAHEFIDASVEERDRLQKAEIERQKRDKKTAQIITAGSFKTLASGSGDGTIKLSNPESGQEIRTLTGHNDYVNSVSISPDGKTLASGSGDGTIKLSNPESGEEIRTLTGHDSSVESVSISPDGKTLASGSEDGTIKLWDLSLDFLMVRNCNQVRAYLENPNSDVRDEDRGLCDGIGEEK